MKYCTEYLYTNAYRLGLAGQNWSKWLLCLPKTLHTDHAGLGRVSNKPQRWAEGLIT